MDLKEQFHAIRPRYEELRGQVAIVTGSSRGIGRGVALRLGREGMKVVITSNVAEDVNQTVAAFKELGIETLGIVAELNDDNAIREIIDQTIETFGSLHLLVNNAALLSRKNIFDVNDEMLDDHIKVNIRTPYIGTQYAAEKMRDMGIKGNIIQISSVGGLRVHWRALPYDMTKGAIDTMTRAMASELAPYGIRVNAIAPGAIDNGWVAKATAEGVAELVERIPMARIGRPDDIASGIAFLASEDATYITGQIVYIDGGITMQLSPKTAQV